ncbi:uncharacterized protein BDR25DRAFT_210362 [Lindgomyces ingoldianus]|uniref:Uncharacterized protein n=1 Tax=Lindgomyces ingoldianus TaxID=673940 RepID=A0ACB6RBN2_9PLEO|nr:uncharacterized protein BDR25DRAFT_210362 [Lindgomyces ingoldianus]KAF2476507.1 hypothetical protein BDR25DRAFT_210362 [Lindgomyces ingoldianus]
MAVGSPPRYLKGPSHRRTSSALAVVQEETPALADQPPPVMSPKSKSEPDLGGASELSALPLPGDSTHGGSALLGNNSICTSPTPTPGLSRTNSFSNSSSYQDEGSDAEDASFFPPVERLTMFDFIENLALPQRIEKLQTTWQAQAEKVKRHQARLRKQGLSTKDRVVEEWRRRIPTPDEQLDKYKKRVRHSVDRLNTRWNDASAVTAREKASFIAGVMNVFVSGYLVGARPEFFPIWYSVQLLYFMPIRFYTYHKKGYHYFLADLCYFVNVLALLSIWVFPGSKRLFISTYCLAFGNNAVAIAMWRNSLVFHSMDKVVSLFIHIMPCVTLHCLVHLLPLDYQQQRYPAIYNIRTSAPDSPGHYSLPQMMLWATIPYAIWQLSYHFMITVRRREKIAAGRPTSFTWLRKSYAKTWIGRFVLSLPEFLQEPAFMMIQYFYACLTMIPCPLWFWYRWFSGGFLAVVFMWSIYNGATYYIDVFGKRFQKELEALKQDVAKWQSSPGMESGLPPMTPSEGLGERKNSEKDIEKIPPLEGSTGAKVDGDGDVRERK